MMFRPKPFPRSTSHPKMQEVTGEFEHPVVRPRTKISSENTSKIHLGNQKMPRRVVEELKTKFNSNDLPVMRNSNQSINIRNGSSTLANRAPPHPPYRLFGDTLLREGKSRSLDNLADTFVSTNLRGGDHIPLHRFSHVEPSNPFGTFQGDHSKIEGLWKPSVRRVSSIRLNL
ncbi:hypothetical protein COOONC_20013 [Cooperia oncophora]